MDRGVKGDGRGRALAVLPRMCSLCWHGTRIWRFTGDGRATWISGVRPAPCRLWSLPRRGGHARMSPLDDFGFVAFASVAVGVGGLEVVGFVESARVAGTGYRFAASANIEHGEDLGDYVIDKGALEFHLRGTYPAAFVVAVVYVAEYLAAMVGVPAAGRVRFVYLQAVWIDRWLGRRSSPALRKLRTTPELGSLVFTALSDPTNHPGAAARAFRGLLRRRRWILGHLEKQQQMLARSVKTKGLSVRNPLEEGDPPRRAGGAVTWLFVGWRQRRALPLGLVSVVWSRRRAT